MEFATDKDNNRFRYDGNQWVKAEFAYDESDNEFSWDGNDWAKVNTEAQDFADKKYGSPSETPLPKEGEQQGGLGDFVDQTKAAFFESYGADAAAVRIVTGNETIAGAAEDYFYDAGDEARKTLSNDSIDAQSKSWLSDKEGEVFGEAWGDIDSWISGSASAAGSLGAIIAGGALTKGLAKVALRGIGKGMVRGSLADRRTGAAIYGGLEGGMVGGSAGRAVEEAILRMPDEVIREAPAFQDAYAELISEGYSRSEALDQGRMVFARSTAAMATVGGAAFGVATGVIAGKYINDAIGGYLEGTAKQKIAKGVAVEGGTESLQGGGQQFIENAGIRRADESQELLEGVAEAGVAEGLFGGLAGGAIGAGSAYKYEGDSSTPQDLTDTTFGDVSIPEGYSPIQGPQLLPEPAGYADVRREREAEPYGPPQPEAPPEPDFVVTPSGMAADSQQSVDEAYDLTRSNRPAIENQNIIYGEGPTREQPRNDGMEEEFPQGYNVNRDEVMTLQQPEVVPDEPAAPQQLAIENQNIIYGEGPTREQPRNNAMEEEFPQGYNVDTYEGGKEFKPLKDITIKQQFTLEDTGEQVEVSERADRLFSKIDKRRNALTLLLECVGK